MGLVCIARFANPVEASVAQGMLESNGIRSILDNSTVADVLPMLSVSAPVRLMVNERDAGNAIGLLREHGDADR